MSRSPATSSGVASGATVVSSPSRTPHRGRSVDESASLAHVVAGTPQIVQTGGGAADRSYTYDYAYGPDARQQAVYDDCVAPLVTAYVNGFNCTVLAYGQTGSGKTYTMSPIYERAMAGVYYNSAAVIDADGRYHVVWFSGDGVPYRTTKATAG